MVDGQLLGLRRFSPMDLAEQVLLSFPEELVGKLPSVWYNLSETLNHHTEQQKPLSKKLRLLPLVYLYFT